MTSDQPHRISRRRLLTWAAGIGAVSIPGVLAGCDSGGSQAGPEGPDLSGVDPVELGADLEGPLYKEGYVGPRAREHSAFGDGETVFRVVVPQDATIVGDWNDNEATRWFEEATGVKVEFQSVLITGADGSTDLTKINAMLSGGDLPDAFMGIPFTVAQIALYGQQGVFQPLDDLIEVYAPETRQAMSDYPDLRSLRVGTDDTLYTMLGVNDCYHCSSSPGRAWINQDHLDEIGAEMPTTTDQLREVLLELQALSPGGSDFIPFASGSTDYLDNYFMQSFLYSPPGDQNGGWLRLNSGSVELTPTLPEWREALRYLRRLNLDGLLTATNFSMTGEEMQAAGNNGRIGFARTYWWGSFFNPVTLDADAPWRRYVPVPPLEGPEGVRYAQWNHYAYATAGLQVTRSCEQPEVMVQWSDFQMNLEAVMRAYDGNKDDNWFYSESGATAIDGEQALFRDVQWPAPEGQSWNQYATMYRSLDFRGGQEVDPDAPTYEAGLYAAGQMYQEFAEPQEMQLPPLVIGDAESAQVADTATSINQHVRTHMSQFSLGQKDIDDDADWQEYVDTFDAMNVPAYLDIFQKAYDSRPS
jgi:putative aldouronate transport system substrate-binding protein